MFVRGCGVVAWWAHLVIVGLERLELRPSALELILELCHVAHRAPLPGNQPAPAWLQPFARASGHRDRPPALLIDDVEQLEQCPFGVWVVT